MLICRGIDETLEFLGYMIVCAPDFPAEDQITMASAFNNVRHGVRTIATSTSNQPVLEKLLSAGDYLNKSETLFLDGDETEGLRVLQLAYHVLLALDPS